MHRNPCGAAWTQSIEDTLSHTDFCFAQTGENCQTIDNLTFLYYIIKNLTIKF